MKTSQNFFNDGNKKIISEDFESALSNFTEAISIDPTDTSSYINRGFLRGKLNDTIGGIADFTLALEIDPEDDVA